MGIFKASGVLNQDARNNRKLKRSEGNNVDCMSDNEFRYPPVQWNSFKRPSVSDYCVDSYYCRLINEQRSSSIEYIKSECDIKRYSQYDLKGLRDNPA